MSGVVLRAYRADDLDPALDLWRRAWNAAMPEIDFAARMDWWRGRWSNELIPNNQVTVAEAGNALVGFVVIDPKSGYLDQIVVDPEYWGSKAAKMLLDEAIRISPRGITLDVNQNNERAIKFYERENFTRIGEGKNEISGKPTYRYAWKS
jgi:putative acetyltransferase